MRILFFFGTRPEAIKMSPLIKEFGSLPELFDVRVCVSSQHREMLDQVLNFFELAPDYDLDIMKKGQDLFDITAKALAGLKRVLADWKPDWLIVQGDTTTTFAGALAAFYEGVRVAHIEAGLRSFHKQAPFPEEINRVLTTHLSALHFAPTQKARENLIREGVRSKDIFVTGNTSIDALLLCLKKISGKRPEDFSLFKGIDFSKRIILVTGHRRESFGRPFRDICSAIKKIAKQKDLELIYPVHLNPNVRGPVFSRLKDISNIHLIEPLRYPEFVWLMNKSHIILTDSGGVQEEAPSLGKPVLVLRDVTERTEGIKAGTAKLVGTDAQRITGAVFRLLDSEREYAKMARAINPYGDGRASRRIARRLAS